MGARQGERESSGCQGRVRAKDKNLEEGFGARGRGRDWGRGWD